MEWLIAHGLVGRSDLPIPEWLFGWAAAIVLIVSFVALAVLWPEPKLEGERGGWRRLFALPQLPVDIVCGAIGVFLFGVTIWAGFAGEQTAAANWASTFVYVIFWLGFAAASVLFGDVFRAFNPWRAIARAVAGVAKLAAGGSLPAPLPYPERLGRWPAAAGIFAFAFMELAASNGDMPQNIAIATLVYSAATWIAMALYGIDRWIERGEAFSVYFNLFSRISVWERRGRDIGLRRPLSGLAALNPLPGTVPLLGRDDRLGHLRRRVRGQAVGRHRARHVGLLPGPRALARERADGHLHDRPACGGPARLRLLPARHRRRAQRRRRIQLAAAGERVHPFARADRVRLRRGALHDAAAVPGPGDLVPRLRPARARATTTSEPRTARSTTRSSARTRPGTGRSAS